jgi:NADH pyrophosphatase NudC (nudix superfamily)
MTIAFAALLILAAIAYTLLVREKNLAPLESESPLKHFDDAKARIYENLRDLQFEYRLGKLSDEDYQRTKKDMQTELAVVLAQRAEAEAALPGAQKSPASPKPSPKPASTGSSCPHCNDEFQEKLKFCGQCGKPIEVAG